MTEYEPSHLVDELQRLNEQRRIESDIYQVYHQINVEPNILNQRVLVFAGENWAHGVAGLVAGKLVSTFGKPVFLICIEENGARGSARSVKGFNIFKAMSNNSNILSKFGGHEMAGGFSLDIDRIEEF